MKLKIDENLSAEVAVLLRSAGHDVETVMGEGIVEEQRLRIRE